MADLPVPDVKKTSSWSAIWVLPIIALLIGGWLGWRAYDSAGVVIKVRFDSGEGIQVNKTELIYKGISVGKVVDLHVTPDVSAVDASIEVRKEAAPYLSKNSRFWLVKPRVSMAGVTGLETLMSGNYIAIDPALGEPERNFVALKEPPAISDAIAGLHLTLKADRLGSLEAGSPIYYQQIQVGQIKSYQLAEDQRGVDIKVFIEPEYAHLVRKHTRFWNASGVTISGGLSGFKVRTESLVSIAAGGIAFATPEHRRDSPPTDASIPFRLYEDFDAAQSGLKVLLRLKSVDALEPGKTPVIYNGVQVGTLKSMDMGKDFSQATAELTMDPRTEELLVEGTEFWTVKPSISLAGITGLEALVKGNYIEVRFSKEGAPTREFVVREKAPPLKENAPGLHLNLTSERVGSLQAGSPVLYRQMRVGTVQSTQLSSDKRSVTFTVHIPPEFSNLVNDSTRFWNASGVTLKGGLSGVEVKSESLESLIMGGISFDTPDLNKPRRKSEFVLYDSEDKASSRGVMLDIRVPSADGLNVGTPVRFKGLEVGEIESIELLSDLSGVVLKARVVQAEQRIAVAGTEFWVVKPELGLARTANLDTLVSGKYLEVAPAPRPGAVKTSFVARESAPLNTTSGEKGLRIVLSAPQRGSLKPGVAVSYREIPVGKVTSFKLGPNSDRVLIELLIEPRYAPLVRSGTRFWNTSGIGVDAGLFKGVKVRTDSLESMLEGGIAFATPDNPQMGGPAYAGQTFVLFDDPQDDWLKWAPKISLGK